MNTALLSCVAAGPLFALLTAGVYRAALWMLGGSPTLGHAGWGLGLSLVACFTAWSNAFRRADTSAPDVERDALRDAAEEALSALSDKSIAYTPAGAATRQALRLALGHPLAPLCGGCCADLGEHSPTCTERPAYLRASAGKGGAA